MGFYLQRHSFIFLSKEDSVDEHILAGIRWRRVSGAPSYVFSLYRSDSALNTYSELLWVDDSLKILKRLTIHPPFPSKYTIINLLFLLPDNRIGFAGVIANQGMCTIMGWVDHNFDSYYIDTFLCNIVDPFYVWNTSVTVDDTGYVHLLKGLTRYIHWWRAFFQNDSFSVDVVYPLNAFTPEAYLHRILIHPQSRRLFAVGASRGTLASWQSVTFFPILRLDNGTFPKVDTIVYISNGFSIFSQPARIQHYAMWEDTLLWEGIQYWWYGNLYPTIYTWHLSYIRVKIDSSVLSGVLIDTTIIDAWYNNDPRVADQTIGSFDFIYPYAYSVVRDSQAIRYALGLIMYPPNNGDTSLYYKTNWITAYSVDVRTMQLRWKASWGHDAAYVPWGVVATEDSGCIVYGWRMTTDPNDPNFGFGDAFLWRIDKNGKVVKTLGSVPPAMLVVYPNPVEDYFYVRAHKVPLERIVCYDVQGCLIKEWRRSDWEKIDKDLWRVGVSGLSSGVYLLQF